MRTTFTRNNDDWTDDWMVEINKIFGKAGKVAGPSAPLGRQGW